MTILLFALIVYAIISFVKPFVGLLILILALITNVLATFIPQVYGISCSLIMESVLIIAWLISMGSTKRLPYLNDYQTISVILFMLLTLVFRYYYDAMYLPTGRFALKDTFISLLIYLLIIYYASSFKKLTVILRVFAISGLIYSFLSFIQYVLGNGIGSNEQYVRMTAMQSLDTNYLAANLCMILPLVYYEAKYDSSKLWRYISWICIPAILLNIAFTFSRGGFVIICVVSLLIIYVERKELGWLARFITILAIICVIVPSAYWSRMKTIKDPENIAHSRINLQKVSFKATLENPLTGVGHQKLVKVKRGNIRRLEIDYFRSRDVKYVIATHNAYLEIAFSSGIPMLLLFLFIFIFSFNNLGILGTYFSKNNMNDLLKLTSLLKISIIAYLAVCMCLSLVLPLQIILILAIILALKKKVVKGKISSFGKDKVKIIEKDNFIEGKVSIIS